MFYTQSKDMAVPNFIFKILFIYIFNMGIYLHVYVPHALSAISGQNKASEFKFHSLSLSADAEI
jgi:ABC-type microcin C transport system permease subunit YejB